MFEYNEVVGGWCIAGLYDTPADDKQHDGDRIGGGGSVGVVVSTLHALSPH